MYRSPAVLTPENNSGKHWAGGWVGLRLSL